jgi:hypothetical protein
MVVLRHSNIVISEAQDVAKVFQDLLTREDNIDQDKEHFYVMHVNSRQQINLVELVAIGTLTNTALHPRETFRWAVIEGTDLASERRCRRITDLIQDRTHIISRLASNQSQTTTSTLTTP